VPLPVFLWPLLFAPLPVVWWPLLCVPLRCYLCGCWPFALFPSWSCVATLLARERGLSLVSFCGCRTFAVFPLGLASLRSLPGRRLSLVSFVAVGYRSPFSPRGLASLRSLPTSGGSLWFPFVGAGRSPFFRSVLRRYAPCPGGGSLWFPLWLWVAVRPFPLVVLRRYAPCPRAGLSLVSFCGCRPFAVFPLGLASLRSLPARGSLCFPLWVLPLQLVAGFATSCNVTVY